MSNSPRSRGVLLPRFGQVLVVIVLLCAGWLVWSQSREPVSIPQPAPPAVVDPADKLRAIEKIANLGPEAVPELLEIIADPDPLVRRYTLLGLGRIGPEAAAARDQVRERLSDEVPQVRVYALQALWRITRDPDELVLRSHCGCNRSREDRSGREIGRSCTRRNATATRQPALQFAQWSFPRSASRLEVSHSRAR